MTIKQIPIFMLGLFFVLNLEAMHFTKNLAILGELLYLAVEG